jgi:biopolymer transport protein ExbB
VIDVIKAGGWLMLPIIACSVIALTIIVERFLSLRHQRVLPKNLVTTLRVWGKSGKIPVINLEKLAVKSPLGRIVAAGLANREHGREIVKESIEDTGRHVVHELERFLNSLGTIAAITPLLGLLGTVVGMIDVFTVISMEGTEEAEQLAGGISQALITTAAGLTVAIPSLLFYRYFCGKVETLVVRMEEEAMRLVDIIHTMSSKPPSSMN